ncbi:hypothetical protein CBA19CS11_28220 [Caballeronia novacaledonica]|uniref:hypothetical protein n=1 Tax=Caballeronia novacaledonica TaxID=1544861 RepID=UPI001EE367C6|nr:hypothetical protein [Caballeronia novacaledonica]GJH12804.1 hypothetical protein CBA19CS11_28220 [Caballeronia novacaledonica]
MAEEAFWFLMIGGIARLPLTAAMVYVDGAAYSVVLLVLGLCTSMTFNAGLSRTFAASVFAASSALGIGWAFGASVVILAVRLSRRSGMEGFFALGLMVFSYGYAFNALFAAGVALTREELKGSSRQGAKRSARNGGTRQARGSAKGS